ncbi:MAG: ribonuclease III [Verrucomicrobia bacterium]|nr:ribonuclease III [Verrucomicrobiota bacterium]
MPDLEALQSSLGHHFRDQELLKLALTHPSVAHERDGASPHNQRLEFLGDSVIGLALTSELYRKFPRLEEGPLTKARAQMVNERSLASLALLLGLGQHLILGRSEDANGGRDRPRILADTFEALIGAVYLDSDFETARNVLLEQLQDSWGQLGGLPTIDNPKGELQELLQPGSHEPPVYRTESAEGPDHDRVFECSVWHRSIQLGRGRGRSKKLAETAAALDALKTLRDGSERLNDPVLD